MTLINRFATAAIAILGLQPPPGLASDLSTNPEYLKFERYIAWGYLGTYAGNEGTIRTFEGRRMTLQLNHKDLQGKPTLTTVFSFHTEGEARVCRVDYEGEENLVKQTASKNVCQPLNAFTSHQIEDITTYSCRHAQKEEAREFLPYCLNNPRSRIKNIIIPD